MAPRRAPLLLAALVLLAACGSAGATSGAPSPNAAPSAPRLPSPTVLTAPAPTAAPTQVEVSAAHVPATAAPPETNAARPLNTFETVAPDALVQVDGVLLVGDSVMESAGPDYYDTIGPALEQMGWAPVVDARRGRTTPQAIRIVDERAGEGTVPDVVVVLIGHNDAPSPALYRSRLEELTRLLQGTPRVVILTLREFEDAYASMNAVLRSLPSRHPNVEVVEWDAVVRDAPGALSGDRLHLTRSGAELLATTIAAALGPSPLYPPLG